MQVAVTPQGANQRALLTEGGQWYNLTAAFQAYQGMGAQRTAERPFTSLEPFLAEGLLTPEFLGEMMTALRKNDRLDAVKLAQTPTAFGLPVRPGKIICIGRNYAAHASETGHAPPKEPIFFAKASSACIPDGEPIVVKEWYGQVDHEAELAVVIGRRAKDVRPEDAQAFITGYTLLNDVTAREMQKTDIDGGHPWFRSKSIDTFCPLGPVIALPDEVSWPVEVDIALTVNGAIRQQSSTRLFLFGIAEVLAYVSRFITLEPGDVIATGTPDGIGPIRPGDTVEVQVPAIGVLRNPVVEG